MAIPAKVDEATGDPATSLDGRGPAGRTILLRSEQGLGDTLHFIRYAELIAQRGAQVLIEVQRPLLPLLERSGFRNLFAKGSPHPVFDVHAPLLSLPGLGGTTLDNIPYRVPYLTADPGWSSSGATCSAVGGK